MTDWTPVAEALQRASERVRVVNDTRTPPAQASRKEWVDTEEAYNRLADQRLHSFVPVELRPREVIECEDAVGPLAHRPLEPEDEESYAEFIRRTLGTRPFQHSFHMVDLLDSRIREEEEYNWFTPTHPSFRSDVDKG